MEPTNRPLAEITKQEFFDNFRTEAQLLEAVLEWWKGIEADEEKCACVIVGIWFECASDLSSIGAVVVWTYVTQATLKEDLKTLKGLATDVSKMKVIGAPEETSDN